MAQNFSRGRVRAVLGLILGVALILIGSLVWWSHHRTSDPAPFGAGALSSLASSPTASTSTATSTVVPKTTRPAASTSATPTPRPTASSAPPATPPGPPGSPIRVQIPSAGIDASVVPVGVTADGQMAIPDDIRVVGWYRWSSQPGAMAGATVLAGHVDSAVAGLGSLFRLNTVSSGATVTVTTSAGTRRYQVVERQSYRKTVLPLAQIFTRTGPPHLTVITCGGTFDRSTRSYESNIVVVAVPVS